MLSKSDWAGSRMSELKNQRWERFAQNLVSGMTIDGAYESAGYKRNPGNAGRLNKNERVAARVRELQGAAAKGAELRAEDIIAGLKRNYAVAAGLMPIAQGPIKDNGVPTEPYRLKVDLHAANKSLELLGKTIGLFADDSREQAPAAVIIQYPIRGK